MWRGFLRSEDVSEFMACIALQQDDLHFGPDLDWIDDQAVVGRDLAGLLRSIHQSRSRGRQFYVSQVPNVGNPQFTQERPYAELAFSDAGCNPEHISSLRNRVPDLDAVRACRACDQSLGN